MTEDILTATFTTLQRRFSRLAHGILNKDEDVEDALQEAFCRLWPKRERIRSRQEAEALVTTTVKHISIDLLRRNQVRQPLPLDEERDAPLDFGADETEEQEERFRQVERLIEQELTETQRAILQRKEYDGLSLNEIAAELRMQPAAVRMQLSRARKLIRTLYQKNREV